MSTCPSHSALFDFIDTRIMSSGIRSEILLADHSSGPVAVAGVRAILSDPDTSTGTSDAVWSELILRARSQRDPWQLVAVWAMTSGLRAASWRLAQRGGVDHADAQSEIVLGFLEALRTIDLDRTDGSQTPVADRRTVTAGQIDKGRLEGERLGSLADRAGLRDRARCRQAADHLDRVVRSIRLGERGIREGFPRTCSARRVHSSGACRHVGRDGGRR